MKKNKCAPLIKLLRSYAVNARLEGGALIACHADKRISLSIAEENTTITYDAPVVHIDQVINAPEKITALILSKLKLNKTIYARNCTVKRVAKQEAELFFEKYHLLNSAQSAFNLGLFYKDELMSLASFSKGRKMNRLPEHQRSYELIRFCCISGITVTGGLTRLIKTFCEEKKAGDIMTYVDKELSDGSSFLKVGFKKHSETMPNYFLVDKSTFVRVPALKDTEYNADTFYLSRNNGNLKLVYTPDASI